MIKIDEIIKKRCELLFKYKFKPNLLLKRLKSSSFNRLIVNVYLTNINNKIRTKK